MLKYFSLLYVLLSDEFELEEIVVSEEVILPDTPEIKCEPVSPSCSTVTVSPAKEMDTSVPMSIKGIDPLRDKSALKYIRRPTRPVRLFSYTDRDLQKEFLPKDDSTKNLALQLLNIVKSVNTQRKVNIKNGSMVPNFYIMATKCDATPDQKIIEMDSKSIVNLVKDIVHMIKIGLYRQIDYVDIICDSPAIFLIKYLKVKVWDSNMNAVYVVTSEYLHPYVCKIKAAEEEEQKALSRKMSSSIPVSASSTVSKRKKSTTTQSKKMKVKPCEGESSSQVVPATTIKSDEEIVEGILSKYLEWEAVQFFISQMKVAGKSHTQYRWKDDDKSFALNLLRKSPTEYSILFQKFVLPSDKTIEKYVQKLQNNK